jgi:hypothetical protein
MCVRNYIYIYIRKIFEENFYIFLIFYFLVNDEAINLHENKIDFTYNLVDKLFVNATRYTMFEND